MFKTGVFFSSLWSLWSTQLQTVELLICGKGVEAITSFSAVLKVESITC